MTEKQFNKYEREFESLLAADEVNSKEKISDFAKNLYEKIRTVNKNEINTDFFEIFYEFALLSLCYFSFKVCRLQEEKITVKNEIIGNFQILKLYGISENLEDYADNDRIKVEELKNTKYRIQFESFIKSKICETELFDENLCVFLNIISQSVECTISTLPFMNFCASSYNFKRLRKILNKTVLNYFMDYIELTKNYKNTIHENLRRLIEIEEKSLINSNLAKIMSPNNVSAEYVKKYFFYGKIFFNFDENSEREKRQFYAAEMIFNKVFFNEHSYRFDGFRNKFLPKSHSGIFTEVASLFGENLRDNYGIAICLFLLLTEIGFDEFTVLFPNVRDERKYDVDAYYLQKIDYFLKNWHDRYDKSGNSDMKKLFQPYEETLSECSYLQLYLAEKQQTEEKEFVKSVNTKILSAMLFFAVYNICGSYRVDTYADTTRKERVAKKAAIENPFFDAINDGSWLSPKKQVSIYNSVAKEFNFQGFDFEKRFPFTSVSFKNLNDNWTLINLLYSISRRQVDSKEYLLRQMNLLREKQKVLFPFERKQGVFTNVYEARESQKKLAKIDVGFKISNFAHNIYPFSSLVFADKFGSSMIFKRDVVCKFICETDSVINQTENSEGVLDYRAMNKKALATRYLYKDRNMATHYSLHSSVESLLNPKNWENLIYSLLDFEEEILFNLCDSDYAKHDYVYNRHRDDPIFFVYHYLLDEITDLLRILRMKVCKAAEIPFEFMKHIRYGDSIEFYKNFLASVKAKSVKNLTYSYEKYKENNKPNSDKLFAERLEKMLNMMFAVNGTNEDGFEHNSSFIDFYDRYYAESAFYLVYLTLSFIQVKES